MEKTLWGGRFKKKIDKDFFEFQKSIKYDYKLATYDIVHSLIHVAALEKTGILSEPEKNKLIKELKKIRKEIKKPGFEYNKNSEDIHTYIQNKVEKKLGKLALKLHTLRSRNDQIVFDEKTYCFFRSGDIIKLLDDLLKSINSVGRKHKGLKIVGYTHTQKAQPVFFCDYINAFWYMLNRDRERLINFQKNIKIYIGAGALAGSSIAKNAYNKAIKEMQKHIPQDNFFVVKPYINSLDNISDRDFIIEFLSIISIIQMHMSRMSEDFILFSTKEFGFLELPEEFCTGSSLMPHKKNPDFLELVRGYTGRVYGNLMSILTTMKGLPLTYNRDMQLDKEPLFSSVETIQDEIKIMTRLVAKIKPNIPKIENALTDYSLYATAEADKYVREKGMSFKEAHDVVGNLIKKQESLEEKLAKRRIRGKFDFKESLADRIAKLKLK